MNTNCHAETIEEVITLKNKLKEDIEKLLKEFNIRSNKFWVDKIGIGYKRNSDDVFVQVVDLIVSRNDDNEVITLGK